MQKRSRKEVLRLPFVVLFRADMKDILGFAGCHTERKLHNQLRGLRKLLSPSYVADPQSDLSHVAMIVHSIIATPFSRLAQKNNQFASSSVKLFTCGDVGVASASVFVPWASFFHSSSSSSRLMNELFCEWMRFGFSYAHHHQREQRCVLLCCLPLPKSLSMRDDDDRLKQLREIVIAKLLPIRRKHQHEAAA